MQHTTTDIYINGERHENIGVPETYLDAQFEYSRAALDDYQVMLKPHGVYTKRGELHKIVTGGFPIYR